MYQEHYKLWSEHPYFKEVHEELKQLNDEKEIEDRFYTELEFGTGGLRGILAAGTNRMNKYVIRKVTQGLAEYISDHGEEGKRRGVVIAYDSRRFSQEFAQEAALILAKNGVKAYLFDSLRPTPVLSFAVRHLHTLAGIIITASHNPKEYNGYKLYWEDGAQVPPKQADEILARINARESWVDIFPMPKEEAIAQGLLEIIGESIDQVYLQKVKDLALQPQLDQESGAEIKIVYTPLHGAGNVFVRKVLKDMGFSSVFVVPEQEFPDSEFTTVPYPNPEIQTTFELARKYGESEQADLLIATDPDSDRLGVVVRDENNSFVQLTGNQVGVILVNYFLAQKKAAGTLPDNAAIIKTVVTTDLADEVAASYGVKVENVLTGFKFICGKEKEMEEGGWGTFQFGFEESIGYLAGDFVRDKDGVIASLLVAEAALYYKQKEGRTLLQALQQIYNQFGYYLEDQESIYLKGQEGKAEMAMIMETLRNSDISSIGGLTVERIDDYEKRTRKDLINGQEYPLDLPRSNVLRFSFKQGGFATVRPSGTEPKIKFYFSVKGTDPETLKTILEAVRKDILDRVQQVLDK